MVDMDTVLGYIPLAGLNGLTVDITQHLKTIFRLAHKCPESHRYRQTDHTSAGNTYPHCIFDDVSAEFQRYLFRTSSESLCRLGHAQ